MSTIDNILMTSEEHPGRGIGVVDKIQSLSRGVVVLTSLAFSLATICSPHSTDGPIEAWWLQGNFTPSESSYESLPVRAINPKWVRMSVLTYSSLPKAAKGDLAWMHRDGFSFEVNNYFKLPGTVDRELCGVFEDEAGQKGRFLLLLEKKPDGPWRVGFLHQESGSAGFSVFVRKPTGLYWGTCMKCDEFSRLKLDDGKFQLEEAP